MLEKSKEHLKDVSESYVKHMIGSLKIAVKLLLLIPVLLVHAVIPGLFKKTTTDALENILDDRVI